MYTPKKLLATGGCGFIGSNVINHLLDKYSDLHIINIDILNYCANTENVIHSKNYTFIKGDIKDRVLISKIYNLYKIDTVINFAAQSHVDNSFGDSLQFTEDNIIGTHTLLECARIYGGIKRFIHVSTDEVYGEVGDSDICHEKSLLNPTNPYAATKAGAEFIARAYAKSFNIPLIITRGNNVYGPRQYPEKLIPKFIYYLLNDMKCPIHGQGENRRNFLHVQDVAEAFDTILYYGELNEIYNIGIEDEYSVKDILQLLVKLIKKDDTYLEYASFVKDREFNDYRYSIDNTKLMNLGWSPKITFVDGIKSTIEWYSNKELYWETFIFKTGVINVINEQKI